MKRKYKEKSYNSSVYHFAQDENGNNRPVCSFVKPLRAGRLLDTARQAARFVSLLHQERTPSLGGGGRTEQWTTMHAFLVRNKGVSAILIFQKQPN